MYLCMSYCTSIPYVSSDIFHSVRVPGGQIFEILGLVELKADEGSDTLQRVSVVDANPHFCAVGMGARTNR